MGTGRSGTLAPDASSARDAGVNRVIGCLAGKRGLYRYLSGVWWRTIALPGVWAVCRGPRRKAAGKQEIELDSLP